MASAIELYREAYDLDYRKGDWQTAEELYRKIMEQHPYSEEKEYAMIHLERLEKLKADPHNQSLQPIRSKDEPGVLSVLNFIFSLTLIAAMGFAGFYLVQHNKLFTYNDMILQGVLSEKNNDLNDAILQFKNAQDILPQNPLAYRYSAELFLNQKMIPQAQNEVQKWELVSPYDHALQSFKTRLSAMEKMKENGK
jgi:tetratricopeptide (TPR) repeat protein